MRVQMLDPPYDGRDAELLAEWLPPGVEPTHLLRMLLRHHPELGDKSMALPHFLHGADSVLDPRTRELIMVRTLARCDNEYEWGIHIALAGDAAGLTAEQWSGTITAAADDPIWDERDSVVLRVADELHESSTLSDRSWALLLEHYTAPQALEIITQAGWGHLTSFLVNALQPQLESFAATFPAAALADRS